MKQQILVEHITPADAQLIESRDQNKNLYLSGRMMASEQKNANGRIYPLAEITNAVAFINQQIKEGKSVMGELEHPDTLTVSLKNVSHVITEAWMDGNNAIGKCKILNTPSGLIVQSLIQGGVRLGVSSRGTGSVSDVSENGEMAGRVQNFIFAALDIVSQPSGPGCYPDVVRESIENPKIMSLAEAVANDPKAQKYLQQEILKFAASIFKK
jgi:hypothetical protein